MLINIDDNELSKINPTNLTVGQWYDKWIEINTQWSDNTKTSRISAGRDYIKPLIGHIKLKDLDLMKYEIFLLSNLRRHIYLKTASCSRQQLIYTILI